jgi:hypothetical protein
MVQGEKRAATVVLAQRQGLLSIIIVAASHQLL